MNSNKAPKTFTRWHELLLKFLRKVITDSNIWLLRRTNGRLGNSFLGVPVLLLTTTGRKSGQPRVQPLYYMRDGARVILVASNAGTSRDPAWLLNIHASPHVTVNIKEKLQKMRAYTAGPEERADLWEKLTAVFPKWQMMEDRSQRSFPVVVLMEID